MSPEMYGKVWLVFPIGIFIFILVLQILQKVMSKKNTYVCSLVFTVCIFLSLWNIIGLNIGTYFVTGIYIVIGFFASFGRASVGGRHRGGGSSGFGGGSSGGGGSSSSW